MRIIRPFQLPQDIDIMLKLVREGFQYPENPGWSVQTDESESLSDQIKRAKKFWPLIRLGQFIFPLLRDVLRGFIYEADHEPVGLINFMRQHNVPEWTIANVTVLPAYRRQGIARQLVESVLSELRARHAKIAYLEVIADNTPAYNLYKELGFVPYMSNSEYDCSPENLVDVIDLPDEYSIEEIGRFDWKRRMEFERRITPPEILRYEPIRANRFRPPLAAYLFSGIFDAINGSKQNRFAIVTHTRETVALGAYHYRTRKGGLNRAELELDPAHPHLAEFFSRHLLAEIRRTAPGRRIEIHLKDWQSALGQTFEVLGCTKRFTFHKMGLLLE